MTHSNPITALALYQYKSCPFCAITRQALDNIKIKVELRDTQLQPHYRSELIQQGGRPQVPCLRIEKQNGETQWLYESRDIIAYLKNLEQQVAKQKNAANA